MGVNKLKGNSSGFTLVELLVVIAIIVVLFSVVLIAVDPARRLGQARDAVRKSDVRTIVSAVIQYAVDNNGSYPPIDANEATVEIIGTGGVGGCTGAIGANCADVDTVDDCLDLTSYLIDDYIAEMPVDPSDGTQGNSKYYVNRTGGGRVEVGSCDPEIESVINIKR